MIKKENDLNGLTENQVDNFIVYKNYKKFISRAAYHNIEIYSILKSELNDLPFLKLQLGLYYNSYIEDLCNNMVNFEEIVFNHIKKFDINGITKKAILNEKIEAEKMLLEAAHIKKFKGLKAGRRKAEIKDAKEYLINFINEEHKVRFIIELTKQYQNCKHKVFNYVMIALVEMNRVRIVEKIELKTSFERALNRKEQSQQNFNKQFSKNLSNSQEIKNIKANIQLIIDNCLTN